MSSVELQDGVKCALTSTELSPTTNESFVKKSKDKEDFKYESGNTRF